jgi:hypothetical protein
MPKKRRKGVEIPPAEQARNRAYGGEYEENRQKVLNAGQTLCAYRFEGSRGFATQTDHVLEVSRGGSSRVGNLVPCCGPCNARKREARKTGRRATRADRVETLVSPDDRPEYLRSDERFPCAGLREQLSPASFDGTEWCIGALGHWSRWWGEKPEDVDPPSRDLLVA